jgi:hypothetical protein
MKNETFYLDGIEYNIDRLYELDYTIIFPIIKKIDSNLVYIKTHYKGIVPIEIQTLKPIIKGSTDKRDGGKPNPVAWYAFGRNQSLDSFLGKKIIFSPMNKKPNFILSELEECTLYSGYFIKYEGDYNKLLKELNSKRMEEYIQNNSRDFRDGWKANNKNVLENFEVYI